jgi:hypothetical protein
MSNELSERVLAALVRVPDWMRRDLSSKDEATRQCAEESIAAAIAAALGEQRHA